MKKRLLSLLLVLSMVMSLLPTAAFASVAELSKNTTEENADILRQLQGFDGGVEQANALLESLGLLDENGDLRLDYKISLDGQEYTLTEASAMLAGPGVDLSRIADVDGTPISLGDLKTIIDIETELQRLKDKYFSGVSYSEESLAGLEKLLAQLQGEGVSLMATTPQGARTAVPTIKLTAAGNANAAPSLSTTAAEVDAGTVRLPFDLYVDGKIGKTMYIPYKIPYGDFKFI